MENFKKQKLKELSNLKNSEILSKINSLDSFDCDVKFGDTIEIDFENFINKRSKILDIAKSLKPWRKGPFKIGDIFIDSEWRSFVKFNLLKPFLNLKDKKVADVGCNNGYYMFKMLEFKPTLLVGFEPSVLMNLQFKFIDKFIKSNIKFELLGVEHMASYGVKFDTIFCLGVLYHRSDPIKCLKELKFSLNENGEVFLDTMFIDRDDEFVLTPENTYSKIPNIYFVPTIKALKNWAKRAKFNNFEVLAIKDTDLEEQRKTDWINGQSLNDFLDPLDKSKTIEGYPAPKRVYVRLS